MSKKTWFTASLLVSGILAGSLPGIVRADAEVLKDVVLVPSGHPFYIQIFEMSGVDAQALVPQKESTDWKPARLKTIDIAEQICKKIGMRLPTREEWITAGSDLGKNKKYTLRGDRLYNDDKKLLANIQGEASFKPIDTEKVGIDEIGTVGMTGNRAEYFKNLDGTWGACGGEYETKDAKEVELDNTCVTNWDHTGTVRCVKEYDSTIQVQLTSAVSDDLKKYIEDTQVAGFRIETIDDLLITHTEADATRDADDSTRLALPDPNRE